MAEACLQFTEAPARLLGDSYSARIAAAGSLRRQRDRIEVALQRISHTGPQGQSLLAELTTITTCIELLAAPRERVESEASRKERRRLETIEAQMARQEEIEGPVPPPATWSARR
jgi:hypothetical protein